MRCLGEELYTCSEDSCSKNKSTLDWTIKFDENEIQINTVLPPRQNNFTLPNKRKILSKTVHYENNVIFLDSGQILTIFPSKTNKYFSSLVSVSDFVRSNGKEIKVLTTYSYKMICE
jgi:hypothetical protein